MEDRPTAQVYWQFTLEFDEATVGNVTAGDQLSCEVNHVTDVEVGQVLVLDRGAEDLFHRTTPSCERMS
ncbi:hypothetical protein D3C81_2305920 [compost metagenome]